MTRRRRQTKLKRGELFVRFEFWELETDAFQHLSADATRVYLFMHMRYDGKNNGAVVFSHRDASQVLRSAWRRGSNALAELVHYGFIRCRNAGEPGPNIRLASEWQMTKFECGGQPASKAFARWDGTAFEPPHTTQKKQLPIGMVKTPRRHGEDASIPNGPDSDRENTKSVGMVKTLSPERRRHGEDTCRYTTPGGPENELQTEQRCRSAPLTAPRKTVRTYAGKPTLRLRTIELLRANGTCTRADITQAFGCGTGEAGRALQQLVEQGVAEKVRHGVYRAVGRA